MFTKKTFHLIVIPDKYLRDNNPRQLNVVHCSDDGGQSNYFGFLQAFWQGAGKKLKLCTFLEANCAGHKGNCAGNSAGLRNLSSNNIFRIPLPVKVDIKFSL